MDIRDDQDDSADLTRRLLHAFKEGIPQDRPQRVYAEGKSGAQVFAVVFSPTTKDAKHLNGLYIVKIDDALWADKQEQFAQVLAKTELAPFLVQYVTRTPAIEGRAAVAYSIALDDLNKVRSLGDLVMAGIPQQHEAVEHLHQVTQVLSDWRHSTRSIRPAREMYTPLELITLMLGSKDATSIRERLGKHLSAWPLTDPYVGVRVGAGGTTGPLSANTRLLPNPVAFLQERPWGTSEVNLPYILGPVHGDLHGDNIMCLSKTERKTAIIDTAEYTELGVPFFDLAYIEFDVLQRLLPVDSAANRAQWIGLLEQLMKNIPVPDNLKNEAPAVAALLAPIREAVEDCCNEQRGQHIDDLYRQVWWTAVSAVGLNFARKGGATRDRHERVSALLYAAFGLQQLLGVPGLELAPVESIQIVSWVSGISNEPLRGEHEASLPVVPPDFVGRQDVVAEVLSRLEDRWPVISIGGFRGVGKTTLASLAVRQSVRGRTHRPDLRELTNAFDILLTIPPKVPIAPGEGLNTLFDHIAQRLNPQVAQLHPAQKRERILQLLRENRVLILIDHPAIIEDAAFLPWAHDVVGDNEVSSKVVIVTRRKDQLIGSETQVAGLADDEGEQLIMLQAERTRATNLVHASPSDKHELIHATGGNPRAIKLVLDQLVETDDALPDAVDALRQGHNDYEAVFRELVIAEYNALSAEERRTLHALMHFEAPAQRDALAAVMRVEPRRVHDLLKPLLDNWFVTREDGLFRLHPLVRAYTLAERAGSGDGAVDDRATRERMADHYKRHIGEHLERLTVRQQTQQDHAMNGHVFEAGNAGAVMRWLVGVEQMEEFAWFLPRVRHLLYESAHGGGADRQHILDCCLHAVQWAKAHSGARADAGAVASVLLEVFRLLGEDPLEQPDLWMADKLLRMSEPVVARAKGAHQALLQPALQLARGKLAYRRALFDAWGSHGDALAALEKSLSEVKPLLEGAYAALATLETRHEDLTLLAWLAWGECHHRSTKQPSESLRQWHAAASEMLVGDGTAHEAWRWSAERIEAALARATARGSSVSKRAEACLALRAHVESVSCLSTRAQGYAALAYCAEQAGQHELAATARQEVERWKQRLALTGPICLEDMLWLHEHR